MTKPSAAARRGSRRRRAGEAGPGGRRARSATRRRRLPGDATALRASGRAKRRGTCCSPVTKPPPRAGEAGRRRASRLGAPARTATATPSSPSGVGAAEPQVRGEPVENPAEHRPRRSGAAQANRAWGWRKARGHEERRAQSRARHRVDAEAAPASTAENGGNNAEDDEGCRVDCGLRTDTRAKGAGLLPRAGESASGRQGRCTRWAATKRAYREERPCVARRRGGDWGRRGWGQGGGAGGVLSSAADYRPRAPWLLLLREPLDLGLG